MSLPWHPHYVLAKEAEAISKLNDKVYFLRPTELISLHAFVHHIPSGVFISGGWVGGWVGID